MYRNQQIKQKTQEFDEDEDFGDTDEHYGIETQGNNMQTDK